MSNVTIKEIAERLGVSLATVSLALNRADARVAQSTRAKVLRAAEEMGYHTSTLARAIKVPLRHVGVALGVAEAQQPLTSQVFAGVLAEATEQNYLPLVHQVAQDLDQAGHAAVLKRVFELYFSKLVDGFILDKRFFFNTSILRLHERGVPVVTVNGFPVRLPSGKILPSVTVDTRDGGRIATAHLLEMGHRRIGLLCPPYTSLPWDQLPWWVTMMIAGYRWAMRRARIPLEPALQVEGDPENRHQTYAAVTSLMHLKDPPTALFIGDDRMAIMAIHALTMMGLRVPQDISIVGFGDLSTVRHLAVPELTTVQVPLRQSGRDALRVLIRLLDKTNDHPTHVVLKPSLVIRQSTQPNRL